MSRRGGRQPAQTQALPPESAQISAAIRSCSSLGASCGLALAPVEVPGRGQDLVGAAGAARGVERPVVAAGLAHDDVGGDRVGAAEPAPDLFFGGGAARRFRRFDVAHPGSDPRFQGRERGGPRGGDRLQVGGGRFGLAADGGDFRAGGDQALVVGVGAALQAGDLAQLARAPRRGPGRPGARAPCRIPRSGPGSRCASRGRRSRTRRGSRSPRSACRSRRSRPAAAPAPPGRAAGGASPPPGPPRSARPRPASSAARRSPSASRPLSCSSRAAAAAASAPGGGEFGLRRPQPFGDRAGFAPGGLDLGLKRVDLGRARRRRDGQQGEQADCCRHLRAHKGDEATAFC